VWKAVVAGQVTPSPWQAHDATIACRPAPDNRLNCLTHATTLMQCVVGLQNEYGSL